MRILQDSRTAQVRLYVNKLTDFCILAAETLRQGRLRERCKFVFAISSSELFEFVPSETHETTKRAHNERIMKNEEIYNIWAEFIFKHQEYFLDNEIQWNNTLNEVKNI